MKKRLLRGTIMVAMCGLLVACASVGAHRIGSSSYPPLADGAGVSVFTEESQMRGKYEVVGVISYSNPGKYQILNLEDAMEPLKSKARELGANGVIIDKTDTIRSGLISTGISVEARAIRLPF
jgi:hypothetical protein